MPNPAPASIQILRPGWLTTVQDLGRPGYQHWGMPVGGAMDRLALLAANRLVGNPDGSAVLEITVQGPELLFEQAATIAVTGADLSPSVNGEAILDWTAVSVLEGDRLAFGARRSGARAYLAVGGGIDVPRVLGSRSTHLASRTGGWSGRALVKGDVVASGVPGPAAERRLGWSVPLSARPPYRPEPRLRCLLGPQANHFLPEAQTRLAEGTYRLLPQSDRMGCRLTGPPLVHVGATDTISEAVPCGAIQVPADQQPILLMADRQTTGGYPKIAVVISADLPLAAQLLPGDSLRFAIITPAEAWAALRDQRAALDAMLPPVNNSPDIRQ